MIYSYTYPILAPASSIPTLSSGGTTAQQNQPGSPKPNSPNTSTNNNNMRGQRSSSPISGSRISKPMVSRKGHHHRTSSSPRKFSPPLDVYETPASYFLELSLPGVPKESVSIDVHEGSSTEGRRKLIIAGKAGSAVPEIGEAEKIRHWLSERNRGEFERVVEFPDDADFGAVKAKMEAGLLRVEVGKKAKKALKVKVDYEA